MDSWLEDYKAKSESLDVHSTNEAYSLQEKEMKAPKTSGGGDYEKHPTGTYPVVCTRIINVGTHWNPKKEKDENKITLYFESPVLMEKGDLAGKPMLLLSTFNFSMYKNAMLCGFIEQWTGKTLTQDEADDFDMESLLGKAGFVNIVHNGDFVNIGSIMPLPQGMEAPQPVGDLIIYDPISNNEAMFNKLTDKVKEKVKNSKEYGQAPVVESENPGAGMNSDFDDELPSFM